MSKMSPADADVSQKSVEPDTYSPSISNGTVGTRWQEIFAELKYTFTTKDGWIGDYVWSMHSRELLAAD